MVGYLEPRLHEVDLALFDIEDLVDLGNEICEGLDDQILSALGLGVVGHLHTHHPYYIPPSHPTHPTNPPIIIIRG